MAKALSGDGAASAQVLREVAGAWKAKAKETNVNIQGLDLDAPLSERIAWALAQGLKIGCVLSRYSSKLQHSTTAQAMDCAEYAARNGI